MKKIIRSKVFWISFVLILILATVLLYNKWKPLPEGISYESDVYYTDDVEFLTDLTYKTKEGKTKHEQEIFSEVFQMIGKAEDFILLDFFLFNGYTDESRDFPKLSETLTNKLIKQKKKHPDLQVVFITDSINNGYHSYEDKNIKKLQNNGVEVVLTNLDKLRDSNSAYSAVWRTFFRWYGQEGKGWLPNPLASEAPKVTVRSYLELFNVKANHRKMIATENAALVTSGNPHDASGFFMNIAFKVKGDIIHDIVEAEQAVIDYSGGQSDINYKKQGTLDTSKPIAIQYLTEGKMYDHVVGEINQATKQEEIWLGMFYIGNRKVINALQDAADRGVDIHMILDPNKVAFGHEKTGLPNLPVASEFHKKNKENITIRWYDSYKDQFHTKLLFIKSKTESTIIGGAANYTTRNLDDLNLENNLKIKAGNDEKVVKDVEQYFLRLWKNQDGIFTADYETLQDKKTPIRKAAYWLQKLTGLTTY